MSPSAQLAPQLIKECSFICEAYNDLIKTWTLPVIHALGMKEPARFNELKRRIQGISATSLAERLTELGKRGLIQRRVYPESPPKVEYSLTQKGRELQSILDELKSWIIKWHK